ncbi:MAG: DUF4423 domain-containing protein [Proteobacteria bacterium]|nr:MAG: DUF4423 domain-containing protein [Pseudomonadota bacterium]
MNVFEEASYREILKKRVKELHREGGKLNWRKIAARISIQYTYLSRALNHAKTHLNEDHLYEVCKLLRFLPNELEYVLALRGLETAESQARRDYLSTRALALKNSQQVGGAVEKSGAIGGDIHFLLSPLGWLTYFALGLPAYRANPRKIAGQLGISAPQLRTILNSLHDLGLMEIGENIYEVKKVNKNHFHYSFDHPLTQLHQQMLRLQCDAHYLRLPEGKRHRFMATFNADEGAFEKIEKLFFAFVKEVEKVAVPAPSKQSYQLNFELFKWF